MSVNPGGATDLVEPVPANAQSSVRQTPGDILREAREQRGLTVQQIADELHLDVRTVQAIEANNFLSLGAPVYAKGHLRKYASVVGLPSQLVITQYETLSDVPVQPSVMPVSTIQPQPRRVSLRIPVMIVAGLLIVGAVVWLASWALDRFGPAQSTVPASTQVEIPAGSGPVIVPVAREGTVVDSSNAPAIVPPPQQREQPARVAPNPASDVALRLQFSESSWVEIYDATNQRLMYGIGQPGQTRTVSGAAPLKVTIGLASAVTINVNNQSIPVPRRTGRDATRFTVSADGSVR
ncbi:MAG TPA: RodZ domain-containing protein [Povalibacter sp.]